MATRTRDQNTLSEGDWNVLCDVCGFKFKSRDIQKRWDGFMVCKEDYEPRHSSDFFRGFPDDSSVPFTRPNNTPEPQTYTDVAGVSYTNDNLPDENTLNTKLISYGTDSDIQYWTEPLDVAYSAGCLNSGTQKIGDQIQIYKLKLGATSDPVNERLRILNHFTEIDNIPGDATGKVITEWNGTDWLVVSYTLY